MNHSFQPLSFNIKPFSLNEYTERREGLDPSFLSFVQTLILYMNAERSHQNRSL